MGNGGTKITILSDVYDDVERRSTENLPHLELDIYLELYR